MQSAFQRSPCSSTRPLASSLVCRYNVVAGMRRQTCSGVKIISGSGAGSAAPAAAAAAHRAVAAAAAAASSSSAAAPDDDPAAAGASASVGGVPWAFGAQTNERLLAWDDSAQAALLQIWLCGELGIEQGALAERVAALGNLLPDLATKLHVLRAPLARELLQDLPAVAERLLALRRLLPGADVSAMAARAPDLMLAAPLARLEAAAAELAAKLPGVDAARLCEREPLLLAANVDALLADARRLAPPGADAVALLARDPSALLDMGAAGMPSTLEYN